MSEDEKIIARVTATLAPPYKVGDRVTVAWETVSFKRCEIYKIGRGWYWVRSLDTGKTGVAVAAKLRPLT